MKEIKWRAWDKLRKEWTNTYSLDLTCTTLIEWIDGLEWREVDKNIKNTIEFMQYIGLKDKKGIEVYEGDILTVWVGACKQATHMIIKNIWGLHVELNRDDNYYRITNFEVIGNIYENPELIS